MKELTTERPPEKADVVVIGSGLAGLAAAYEAAKLGARVVILEKMAYVGGNTALAGGGYACWDSRLKLRERLGLGEDSWQDHMRDIIAAGDGKSIPEMVEVLAKNAPDGLDWLCEMGVPMKNVLIKLPGYSAYRNYQTAVSGKGIIDAVLANVLSLGVALYKNCQVVELCRAESGEVTGVTYASPAGLAHLETSRGVIIAAGGFSRDKEMRMRYCPELNENYNCTNHPGATGEMIRAAQALGAALLHMEYIQLYPCAAPKTGSVDRFAFYCYSGVGFGMIYVDGSGKRFVSEMESRASVSRFQLEHCTCPTWAVFSRKIAEALMMTDTEIQNGIRQKRLIVADTLQALAERLETPFLEETVAAHNAFLAGARPDKLGKRNSDAFLPIGDGPVYAIAQWPSVHYTMGGIRTDASARVINTDGFAIPRLYAAGEVVGGLNGANRMGGSALAECVVFGRLAGQKAME